MAAQTVTGTLSLAGNLTYFTGKEIEDGVLSFAGALTYFTGQEVEDGTLSFAGSIDRKLRSTRTIAGDLSFSGAIVRLQIPTDSRLSFTGGIVRLKKNGIDLQRIAGNLSIAGTLTKTKRRLIISDPQAMLDWSDDGGRTWSNEHWRSIGKIGKYGQRAIWRRLGSSRNRTFRLTITDPIEVEILGANMTAQKGRA